MLNIHVTNNYFLFFKKKLFFYTQQYKKNPYYRFFKKNGRKGLEMELLSRFIAGVMLELDRVIYFKNGISCKFYPRNYRELVLCKSTFNVTMIWLVSKKLLKSDKRL